MRGIVDKFRSLSTMAIGENIRPATFITFSRGSKNGYPHRNHLVSIKLSANTPVDMLRGRRANGASVCDRSSSALRTQILSDDPDFTTSAAR